MLQEIHIAPPLEPSRLLAAASATGRASPQQCTGFAFDTKVVLTDALINRPASSVWRRMLGRAGGCTAAEPT
jgi:hypothetical protein